MEAFTSPAGVNGSEAGAGTICTHGSDFGCIDTYKVDSQIFSTMMTSGVAGLLCLAAFCFLQTFISVYRGRLLSPQVAIKPPVYTGNGAAKYFYWIWATVSLKEKELLATAGMDALMFERLIVFGLQLMAPITVLSCAVLIPVHASSGFLATSKAQLQSDLMGLTMSNIPPGSAILWLHFTFVWAYCLYALWLLDRHYQWYVLLRQQYMTKGDSISTWLGRIPKQQPQGLRSSSALATDSDSAMQQQLFNPASGFARCTWSEAGDAPAAAAEGIPAQPADAAAAALLGSAAESGKEQGRGQVEGVLQHVELAARHYPQLQQQKTQPAQQCVSQSAFAAAMSAESDGFVDPASPGTSSSPPDSRFTSRQSSLKALLPGVKVTNSSSQHLHMHSPTVTFTTADNSGCVEDEESGFACTSAVGGAPATRSSHSARSGATGFSRHLKRIGSFGNCWKGSGDGYSGPEVQHQWQQRQRQHKQHQAAVAAAAAAAEKLGADADWWSFKTGDPLLDRHVVQVDVAGDLAWQQAEGPSAERLHLWWELAAADRNPGGAAAIASGSGAQITSKEVMPAHDDLHGPVRRTKAANIAAVPGTCLLFDKRSLRARKPSVRFRNTVHVQGLSGNLLPLHVSNYAVLVTDVPAGDGSYAGEDEDFGGDEGRRNRPGLLLRMLQASIWSWPCLLSQDDLTDLSSTWKDQSFRAKSMQFSESMRQLIAQHQPEGEPTQQPQEASLPSRQAASSRQRGLRTSSSSGNGCGRQQQVSERQRLVEQTFKQLFKDELHAVIPVINFQAVDELLRQWNQDLQKYIQARALLQLRVEREGRSKSGFRQQGQQQWTSEGAFRAHSSSVHAGSDDPPVPAGAFTDSENGATQQHQQHVPVHDKSICKDAALQQTAELIAADALTLRTQAGLYSKDSMQESWPIANGGRSASIAALKIPGESADGAGSFSGLDEPCKTPRLAPLKPHPVMPERVMTRPRLVTKDEGESATAFGKCCAAVLGILASGKANDINDAEACNDVRAVAQRLEQQRQALVDLEASILEAQKEVSSSADTGSFIVLFKTPAAATLAARSTVFPQSSNSLEAFKVQAAPSPEDMLWQNLWRSPSAKRDESLRCLFWYALLYLVPTGIFTAALNSISYSICNSQSVGPSMAWFCKSHFLQFLFTIILPMVLLMLWQNAVIPSNLYKLELRRGAAVSLSEMERNILLIYVGWELVNLFLGGVLSASLTSQIKMLADNPDQWAMLLGAAFPNSSNFFLNYVITRAFMMNLFRLIMPHGGMWRWIGQMLFTGGTSLSHAATERYRAFITYPASIRYGREPGLILLILLTGVAYSVAAPLITPFVLAYLCTAYLVWRYQMIYVCVRCYESGGKMWPVYFVIVLWCLGLFVVFSSSILIFKHANVQGVLVLPLLPLVYLFARYCNYSYSSRVEHPPLWLAHDAPRTEIDPLVYTPPCLQPHAQGWYPEMGKAWVRWGSPAYLDPTI